MTLSDLDFDLPADRVAIRPTEDRDGARLLVLDRATGAIAHHQFRSLPQLLEPSDLLVRNVSQVIPARLTAYRASGARVELLLLEEQERDCWRALAKPFARTRSGELVRLSSGLEIKLTHAAELADGQLLAHGEGLTEAMHLHGEAPLPPYLKRSATAEDRTRYQTIYARTPGSVAAPTAGLHFTEGLVARLEERGVRLADVILHIGLGTFLPIRTDDLSAHRMHAEQFSVPERTAAEVLAARDRGSRIVAVGTSSVRALESAAPHGILTAGGGLTRLFIQCGYSFQVVDTLLTNFHQPRSTLLALVAAFAGLTNTHAAYASALREGYRFLSYGDAMLVVSRREPLACIP